MNELTSYAARKPEWPGFVAWMSGDDHGDRNYRRRIASEIARWVRNGWTVERVTTEQAKVGLREYGDECKRRKGEPVQQPSFFVDLV